MSLALINCRLSIYGYTVQLYFLRFERELFFNIKNRKPDQ